MNLLNPEVLLLLALLPVAVAFLVWRARLRQAALQRLGESKLIRSLLSAPSDNHRRWQSTLWLLVLGALIIALARPAWGLDAAPVETQGVAMMIVLDVSSSMNAEDLAPSRLERAKLDTRALFAALAGNDIGLILFAGSSIVQFPLTNDTASVSAFLTAVSSQSITDQGTSIEAALRLALDSFDDRRPTAQIVLLLSDGESHNDDPLAAADLAAQRGVVIHVIGYGGAQGQPIPVRDPQGSSIGFQTNRAGEMVLSARDDALLQGLADRTGGLYARAEAGEVAVRRLIERISEAQGALFESRTVELGVERFALFVALALIALSLEILLPMARRMAA